MKLAVYGRQRRYENIASTYIDVAPAIAHNKIMLIDRETVKRQLKFHFELLKRKVIKLLSSC
jgi:hypothetical protein